MTPTPMHARTLLTIFVMLFITAVSSANNETRRSHPKAYTLSDVCRTMLVGRKSLVPTFTDVYQGEIPGPLEYVIDLIWPHGTPIDAIIVDRNVDKTDKKMWSISRRHRNIEVSVTEVIDFSGNILGRFYTTGFTDEVDTNETYEKHLLPLLRERGREVFMIRDRHLHPKEGNVPLANARAKRSKYFTMSDHRFNRYWRNVFDENPNWKHIVFEAQLTYLLPDESIGKRAYLLPPGKISSSEFFEAFLRSQF